MGGLELNKLSLESPATATSSDRANANEETASPNLHGGGELSVISDGEAWTNEFIGKSSLPPKDQGRSHDQMSKVMGRSIRVLSLSCLTGKRGGKAFDL